MLNYLVEFSVCLLDKDKYLNRSEYISEYGRSRIENLSNVVKSLINSLSDYLNKALVYSDLRNVILNRKNYTESDSEYRWLSELSSSQILSCVDFDNLLPDFPLEEKADISYILSYQVDKVESIF